MTLKISSAARNASCDAVVDLVDINTPPGTLKIYTGSQPADPNTTATGTLLATITLPNPAFGSASSGVATLLGVSLTGTGVAAGTAGWFRIQQGAGTGVIDGAVTATGGGGQLELATTTVSVGLSVTVTSGTITQPG